MSLIKQEFIDRLLEDTDIVEYVDPNNKAKKVGANFVIKSPFKEENTPSCILSPAKQMFFDKSVNISGNVINYIMLTKNMNYREAVLELAKFKNKEIEYENEKTAEVYRQKEEKKKNLRPVLAIADKLYKSSLEALPKDSAAWQEIYKRGYTEDTVKTWGIGFAPGNKKLYDQLKEIGKVADGQELGMINENYNDSTFNRLTYAIHDKRNQLIGFASRSLSEDDKVKWRNPTTTEFYNKSLEWFGFNQAFAAICKKKTAWIVEGYNDVIAWHNLGIINTISPFGKEIAEGQINAIKRHVFKIVLCLDNDAPGIEAMLRTIPKLFAAGFNVEVCELPEVVIDEKVKKIDPDEFSRLGLEDFIASELSLEDFFYKNDFIKNGFSWVMEHLVKGENKIEKAEGVKKCLEIINSIDDPTYKSLYQEMLQKHSKFTATQIKNTLKDLEAKKYEEQSYSMGEYILPKELSHIDINSVLPFIKKFRFFQAENEIYAQLPGKEPPYYFKSISNFSIEIIQHMNDDKFAKKLFRIKNNRGTERIFDAPADSMTVLGKFITMIENQGNYRFKGKAEDLDNLKDYLYDEMGTGRAVDVLGWNPEGFFCWNNQVTIPGKGQIKMDENGIFHHNDITYYIPSANSIYANNPTRYLAQKRCIVRQASVTLTEYLTQLRKVHRGHAITGILFTLASAFQDFIAPNVKGFPMLLLYGAASSGKDQLSACLRSFYGVPQSVIALGSKKSTGKAQIREFAQFANVITHLSEYRVGDKETDEMLKGLWDRNGYKYGTIESKVSSEEVPILSAALVTGNDFPTDEALITRFLWEEMMKDKFTAEEKQHYEDLEDMAVTGISSFMADIILHRPEVERRFTKEFRMWSSELTQRKSFKDLKARIITNHSVLGAMYDIFKEQIHFPFTREEMLEHFDEMVENQRRRLETESVSQKFWQRFIAALRGTNDKKLYNNRDFKVVGSSIYIRWTDTYNAIQPTWYMAFDQVCPSRTDLRKKMLDDKSFIGEKGSVKFGKNENNKDMVSTALEFSIDKIKDKEDLLYAIKYQDQSITNIPSTNNNQSENTDLDNKGESDDDLPF